MDKAKEKAKLKKFIGLRGKYYPVERVQEVVTHLGAGVMHHIIDTSKNPKSVFRRLEAMKQQKGLKGQMWLEAAQMLERSGEGKTMAELTVEIKEGFDFTNIDLPPLVKP